jgi:hypothetical protein
MVWATKRTSRLLAKESIHITPKLFIHSIPSFHILVILSALKSHIAELAEFALSQSLGFNVFFCTFTFPPPPPAIFQLPQWSYYV